MKKRITIDKILIEKPEETQPDVRYTRPVALKPVIQDRVYVPDMAHPGEKKELVNYAWEAVSAEEWERLNKAQEIPPWPNEDIAPILLDHPDVVHAKAKLLVAQEKLHDVIDEANLKESRLEEIEAEIGDGSPSREVFDEKRTLEADLEYLRDYSFPAAEREKDDADQRYVSRLQEVYEPVWRDLEGREQEEDRYAVEWLIQAMLAKRKAFIIGEQKALLANQIGQMGHPNGSVVRNAYEFGELVWQQPTMRKLDELLALFESRFGVSIEEVDDEYS